MNCIADFEVLSDLCVENDTKKLKIVHPAGRYELHIKNGPKQATPQSPFLSVQVIFESPDLNTAKELSKEFLTDGLNALAFVTNSRFEYSRILKIVDWTPGESKRGALLFTEFDPANEPVSMLNDSFIESTQKLLEIEMSPQIKRALHWFRLGLAGESVEDTFQFFWFAFEILAEAQKKPLKIHDRCPKCRTDLYCESCKEYPTHKPYPKQAICQLVNDLVANNADELFGFLDMARNALMHGDWLEDIEADIPFSSDYLVDILGKLTCNAILRILPNESLTADLVIGEPDSYVRRKMSAVAHINTVVPLDSDGKLHIENFPKFDVSIKPVGRSPVAETDEDFS
ncbi:methylamine utilization protein MauJ [Geotalea toluenoxydans]|uniref:methylamine utilization protein MauJ n=1 Tax=Geotalea toluenoxydans TaxID=421624 RepID=UPI0006D1FF00|nr:methylamine utilization protein MauJ [Geotalea toluenoxydans]